MCERRCSFNILFDFPLGMNLKMGLLDHLAVLFLIFKETSLLFSIVAVLIYIPTSSE